MEDKTKTPDPFIMIRTAFLTGFVGNLLHDRFHADAQTATAISAICGVMYDYVAYKVKTYFKNV